MTISSRVRGPATRKFTRQSPSPEEQARRVAWGREWGPKVGKSIRDYIRANERT